MSVLPAPQAGVTWLRRHKPELRLSLQMMVGVLLSFVLAPVLGLSQTYWAVLTVVIVMQSSVGGSLKASLERLVATLGGAVWAIAVSVLFALTRHGGMYSPAVVLAVVLSPLCVLVALKPAYRAAPIAAIIVLLSSTEQHGSALHAGLERILEIGLGCLVAFGVSLSVLPSRAHRQLADATAGALRMMADAIALIERGAAAAVPGDVIRAAVGRVVAIADEATRERRNHLTNAPDPAPLVRLLRQLRHDTEMLVRASVQLSSSPVASRLTDSRARVSRAAEAFLHASAEALAQGAPIPSIDDVDAAMAEYALAVEDLRGDGLLELPTQEMAPVFGTVFALRQLRFDLEDFAKSAAAFSPRGP